MLVTGVQAAGAKGVSAIQGAVVDVKATTRTGLVGDSDRDGDQGSASRAKTGEPQPVVFPRSGIPMDQRPVAMRQQHAQARYRADGGDADHDGDAA
jgi:hypothetical protein